MKRFISIGTTAEGLANFTLDELPCGLLSIQLLLVALYCLFEELGLLFNYEKFVVEVPLMILIKINQKLINYKIIVLKMRVVQLVTMTTVMILSINMSYQATFTENLLDHLTLISELMEL